MGVAMGIFEPNAAYVPDLHATQTEAFEANAPALALCDESGAPLVCADLYLVDFSQTLGDEGRELHALGVEDYQTHFGS